MRSACEVDGSFKVCLANHVSSSLKPCPHLETRCWVMAAASTFPTTSGIATVVVASHVAAQLWRGAAVCIVGGGDSPLLNDDVGPGGTVFEGLEYVSRDF